MVEETKAFLSSDGKVFITQEEATKYEEQLIVDETNSKYFKYTKSGEVKGYIRIISDGADHEKYLMWRLIRGVGNPYGLDGKILTTNWSIEEIPAESKESIGKFGTYRVGE